MKSICGIINYLSYGNIKYSLPVKLNPEYDRKFISVIQSIYNRCVKQLCEEKKNMKVYFDENSKLNGFHSPLYYLRDKENRRVVPNTPPSFKFKLFPKSSKFKDLNNEDIPWELLQNVEMKFIQSQENSNL